MDELVARSGDGEIEFALTWLDGGPRSTGAEATHGCLRGHSIWHGEDDAEAELTANSSRPIA